MSTQHFPVIPSHLAVKRKSLVVIAASTTLADSTKAEVERLKFELVVRQMD